MKVYLALVASVLNLYNKLNAAFEAPRESLHTIDSLQSGSLIDPSGVSLNKITSKHFHKSSWVISFPVVVAIYVVSN